VEELALRRIRGEGICPDRRLVSYDGEECK